MKIRKAESFIFETSFNAWQPSTLGSPGGSVGKEFTCYAGDPDLIPGDEDPLEKEMATQSSIFVGNPMDRGAWQAEVHGVGRV